MGFCNGIPSEGQIKAEVLRELRQDSRLKGTNICVEVRDGTVTLTGTVAGVAEVLAALEAANRAESLFYLVNRLSVNADGRPTDAEIAKAVRSALEGDALVPVRSVKVAVSNGWVALNGQVERLREREEAERIVRRTVGVRGVYNLIEVSPHALLVGRVKEHLRVNAH